MIFSKLFLRKFNLYLIFSIIFQTLAFAGSPQLPNDMLKEDVLRLSLDAARLSNSIYSDIDVFAEMPDGFQSLERIVVNCPKKAVVCADAILTLSPQNELHVTFRGTHTKQDWVTDLTLNFVKFTNYAGTELGWVHNGFFNRGWGLIRETLIPKLVFYAKTYPVKSIIISGHSMGGAVASLMAIDLKNTNFVDLNTIPTGVITFGEPRSVYKDSLAMTKNIWKYRYVFGWDAVPTIPAPWQNFKHFGTKVIEMDDKVNGYQQYGFHTDERSYIEPDYPYANGNVGDHLQINYINSLLYFKNNPEDFKVVIPW
jgi:hypothetical protein